MQTSSGSSLFCPEAAAQVPQGKWVGWGRGCPDRRSLVTSWGHLAGPQLMGILRVGPSDRAQVCHRIHRAGWGLQYLCQGVAKVRASRLSSSEEEGKLETRWVPWEPSPARLVPVLAEAGHT